MDKQSHYIQAIHNVYPDFSILSCYRGHPLKGKILCRNLCLAGSPLWAGRRGPKGVWEGHCAIPV